MRIVGTILFRRLFVVINGIYIENVFQFLLRI